MIIRGAVHRSWCLLVVPTLAAFAFLNAITLANADEGARKPIKPDDPRLQTLRGQFVLKKLDAVEKELLQVQSDRRRAQVETTLFEARLKQNKDVAISDPLLEQALLQDLFYLKYREDMGKLERDIQDTIRAVGAEKAGPILADLRKKLAATQKDLAARREVLLGPVREELRKQAKAEGEAKLAEFQDRIKLLKELEAALTEEAERIRLEVIQMEEETKKDGRSAIPRDDGDRLAWAGGPKR